LLSSFILCWITFAFLFWKINNKKHSGLISLSIHIIYSSYFLYGLFHWSEEGSSLVWWFYLLLFLWIHSLINIGQLIFIVIQTRRK
jgi:hypothetical protein